VHNCSGRVRERTTRLISLKQLWGYDASLPSALEKELEQDIAIDQTAEVFVHDRLAERGKIRFGLLKEVWGDDGGDPRHIWSAVRRLGCRMQRLPEYDNRLFVFPPERPKGAPDGTSKEAGEIVQHHRDATLLGPF
jgi:hypothetical protein